YGAALRWPEAKSGRKPARMAGALVILVDGALAAWMGRGERTILTFLENVPDREPGDIAYEIARILAEEVTSGKRRAVYIQEVDCQPAQDTPMAGALLEAGFHHSVHGYLKRIQ
ncbi:MAG TPA: hypothetical protein VFW40_05175, partial [Capsulimonadaceae bacterium]|nr:hypothetical protein [Capsulimonadaceae bacterium]